ncbi:somatostatin receptor type 5-like [Anoplophora glabripennis]|uniref:somatostatin receptor type 5-like n=1 Tax=Anoplophora glabripennis TaxID=217634 RepID=UPI000874D277|nr:somatostatin receptor type 5-like [Anoplophora glabripennis]
MKNESGEDFSWNSSYVYGVDNESGWGDRYFFTYYSEFDGKSPLFAAIEVSIFAFIFVVSVVANASIVVCVFRYPDMRTVTNCFVLNLAAADLLFALTIPAVAYTRIVVSWQLGDVTCRIIPYIQFVSGIVLLWTLALISIDRHRCIVVPPYRSKMTPHQATLSSLLIWISTAIIFIPVALWFRQIRSVNNVPVCTMIFPKSNTIHYSICFVVPVVLFACLLPMGLLVYHYQKIFQKILSTKNAWATSCVMISAVDIKGCNRAQVRRQSELSLSDIFVPWPRKFSAQFATSPNGNNVGRHGSLSHHEEIRLNKHIKVVRVLFLNVVVVLVMWLPITVIMLLIYIDGRRANEDKNYFLKSRHFIVALSIALLNTVVNPLLYGLLSDSFRTCLTRIWCCRSTCKLDIQDAATPSSGKFNCSGKTVKKQSIVNSVSEKSENHNETV